MKLYVDNRENKLHSLITAFNFSNQSGVEQCDASKPIKKNNPSDNLVIEVKQLELGDLILCDDNDEILIVFERKSVNDLASSVHDGRYSEQSSRLNNFTTKNHNIIYIIEGNVERVNSKSKIKPDTLRSCVVSLNLNKGFSTLKTTNIDDTAKWILAYCYKIGKDKELYSKLSSSYENNCDNVGDNTENTNTRTGTGNSHLEHLSKQAKSKYITKENINVYMLSLIPYVSSYIGDIIMKEYKTIVNLTSSLQEDPSCLDGIKIRTNGKERKIGKNVVKNIKEFLLCENC